MNKQVMNELTAGIRLCRVCGAEYIGHGALCETHQAEYLAKQKAEAIEIEKRFKARLAQQSAARRAQRRQEWQEAI